MRFSRHRVSKYEKSISARNGLTANDALISNTMLCEVSRLLSEAADAGPESWNYRSETSMRVLDLLSLIEAITLHETLYTLPARLTDDLHLLEFRNELVKRGIVRELDTTAAHEQIARSLLTGLANVKNPVRVAGSGEDIGTPIDFDRLRDGIAEFLLIQEPKQSKRQQERVDDAASYGYEPYLPPRLDDAQDYFGGGGGSSEALVANSFADCGRALIGWIEYHHSGAYEHCTSILRDMYYVFAAEVFELPYWPQSTRREFTSKFPNYFDRKTLLQLYARLSDAFKADVTDIFDDHKEEVTFIPPFASLVLDRATGKADIIDRIFEIRDEYSSLRSRFTALEAERRDATSISDRLKLRKKQPYLLNEVASAFDRPSLLSLEGVLRYVPEVIKPATAPHDPSSYSAELLLLPIKTLISWWQRRPIAKFFDVADKVKEIDTYEHLLRRFFGDVDFRYYA